MEKLKRYFHIHLSRWCCYISVLTLGAFLMMWGPLVIWVFHTIVGLPCLVMLGGALMASPLAIPNYEFIKEFNLSKGYSLAFMLVLQLITTVVIIVVSFLTLMFVYQ